MHRETSILAAHTFILATHTFILATHTGDKLFYWQDPEVLSLTLDAVLMANTTDDQTNASLRIVSDIFSKLAGCGGVSAFLTGNAVDCVHVIVM